MPKPNITGNLIPKEQFIQIVERQRRDSTPLFTTLEENLEDYTVFQVYMQTEYELAHDVSFNGRNLINQALTQHLSQINQDDPQNHP